MDNIFELVIMLVGALFFIFVLSGASERVTELLKGIIRKITKDKFPRGDWSKLLALIPAVGVVYGLDVDFFSQFELFESVDADMLRVLNAMYLWMASNWIHPRMKEALTKE